VADSEKQKLTDIGRSFQKYDPPKREWLRRMQVVDDMKDTKDNHEY
jgi:hypothetical protein